MIEVGRTAGNVVESLKSQPVVLALVVLQIFTLAAVLYNSIHRQTATDKQLSQLYELLETCVKGNLPIQRGDFIPLPQPRP